MVDVALVMRTTASLALLLASLSACGGPPAAGGPAVAKGASSTVESGTTSPTTDAPTPPRRACEDGSCTPCGDGLCPDGFYCLKGKGAATPGCAWRPECVSSPTCACVKPAGCACKDERGVAMVTCDAP